MQRNKADGVEGKSESSRIMWNWYYSIPGPGLYAQCFA